MQCRIRPQLWEPDLHCRTHWRHHVDISTTWPGSALPESFSVTVHQRLNLRRSTGRSGETSPSFYRRSYTHIPPWSLAQNVTSGACVNSTPTLVPAPLHTALPRLCLRYSTWRSGETNLSAYHRACSHIPPWSLECHFRHSWCSCPYPPLQTKMGTHH